MENPDLVLQETGSRPTYSRLNYVPSGDTLCRDAISSLELHKIVYLDNSQLISLGPLYLLESELVVKTANWIVGFCSIDINVNEIR